MPKEKRKILIWDQANGALDGASLAAAINAARFTVKCNTSASCAVNIIDKTLESGAWGEPVSLIRYERSLFWAKINQIITQKTIRAQTPNYTKITSVELKAAQIAAKVAELTNKISTSLLVVAVACDAVRIWNSISNDKKNGTTRNTVTTVATVVGGWTGGLVGAITVASLGSAIYPGLGTMIGGLIGGMAGGMGGSILAGAAVDAIADECDYDIDDVICIKCKRKVKRRTYCTGVVVRICWLCEKMINFNIVNICNSFRTMKFV